MRLQLRLPEHYTWFTWNTGRAKVLPFLWEGRRNAYNNTIWRKRLQACHWTRRMSASFNYIPASYLTASSSCSLQIWIGKLRESVLDSRFHAQNMASRPWFWNHTTKQSKSQNTGTTYSNHYFQLAKLRPHFFITHTTYPNLNQLITIQKLQYSKVHSSFLTHTIDSCFGSVSQLPCS